MSKSSTNIGTNPHFFSRNSSQKLRGLPIETLRQQQCRCHRSGPCAFLGMWDHKSFLNWSMSFKNAGKPIRRIDMKFKILLSFSNKLWKSNCTWISRRMPSRKLSKRDYPSCCKITSACKQDKVRIEPRLVSHAQSQTIVDSSRFVFRNTFAPPATSASRRSITNQDSSADAPDSTPFLCCLIQERSLSGKLFSKNQRISWWFFPSQQRFS